MPAVPRCICSLIHTLQGFCAGSCRLGRSKSLEALLIVEDHINCWTQTVSTALHLTCSAVIAGTKHELQSMCNVVGSILTCVAHYTRQSSSQRQGSAADARSAGRRSSRLSQQGLLRPCQLQLTSCLFREMHCLRGATKPVESIG